jgi:hypothetical protein
LVHRPRRRRPLQYQVIDGSDFDDLGPGATGLVGRVQSRVEETRRDALAPIDDHRAACNVNVTPPGRQYRWHDDRNRTTALIYLNPVRGGETELCPNYGIRLPDGRPVMAQRVLDRLLMAEPVRARFGRSLTWPRLQAPWW